MASNNDCLDDKGKAIPIFNQTISNGTNFIKIPAKIFTVAGKLRYIMVKVEDSVNNLVLHSEHIKLNTTSSDIIGLNHLDVTIGP